MEMLARLANLPGALPGACAQGLIWGIMAIGVYLTYRILDVADLTVDGSFGTGGAALLVLLLLLAKRIKSKHGPKGEKPLKEKKGKQPETADTPTDELDTPISETDMQ